MPCEIDFNHREAYFTVVASENGTGAPLTKRARDDSFMQLNFLSSQIIQAAINVHKSLGPGLLESAYQHCMLIELVEEMSLNTQSEVDVTVTYRG